MIYLAYDSNKRKFFSGFSHQVLVFLGKLIRNKSMSNSKKLSQERFGQFAERYVQSQHHAKGYDLDRLVEIAQPQKTWQALDIATGGGHTALKFAPYVAHVTVTDITPRMLEQAQTFITSQVDNVSFKIADAEDLPFEDETFDLVTCRIAPHHFPDVAKFVSEAARVLKAGGLFLLQDQLLPEEKTIANIIEHFEKVRDPSHHCAFPLSQWIAMFEAAQLSVEHTEEITKRQQLIKWAKVQDNSEETIAELVNIVSAAPKGLRTWMQPEAWETKEASFTHHHVIVAGRKSN
jgi:ubiquinone/menaquinone biosynthesis C-methylase UbiE